jgi:serine/threonine protein kinase
MGAHEATSQLGARFGSARVLHAGSRFTVYETRDSNTNQLLTLKTATNGAGAWLEDVLKHEARVLGLLSWHPHVRRLHGTVQLPGGRGALLLEPCIGTLATSAAESSALPLQLAAELGIRIAGALESTHRSGYIHCDVRPATVFVSASGEHVLGGFDASIGIGDATVPPLQTLTAHTAPELAEGAPPTPASDVYGLGSTLYELVAGRTAFDSYAGESPAAVMARMLRHPAPPILAPDVPLEISDLLTWALHPDPAQRPPGPAWLAEELARLQVRQGWARTHLVVR